MDSWFQQLFDILGRQKDTFDAERVLPKIYEEFDLLVREGNAEELKDIYGYLNEHHPIQTSDKTYNKKMGIAFKKEVMLRLVMLEDFSLLDEEITRHLASGDTKAVNSYLKMWKDKSFISSHLQMIVDNYGPIEAPKPKVSVETKPKPTQTPEPKSMEPKVIEEESLDESAQPEPSVAEEPTPKEQPKPIEETPVIQATESPVPKEEIAQPIPSQEKDRAVPEKENKPEPEPEPEKIPVAKGFPEAKPEPKPTKPEKTPISKPVEAKHEPQPHKKVKEKKAKPEPEVKHELPPSEKAPKVPETQAHLVTKLPSDAAAIKRSQTPSTSVDFFDFVDIISSTYKIVLSKDVLTTLANPKPAFYRVVMEYVDALNRPAEYFINLLKTSEQYGYFDMVEFLADRSVALRRLATFNIALLNDDDLDHRFRLLDILAEENLDVIKMSRNEWRLRAWIDTEFTPNETTWTLREHAEIAAKAAPSMIPNYEATEAINYFKTNIIPIRHRLIDMTDASHIYWSMMLAAALGIYVIRSHVSDYIESMDWIAESAKLLSERTDDKALRSLIKTLSMTYVRRIYSQGTSSDNYEEWWIGQKEDMIESKQNALNRLREID